MDAATKNNKTEIKRIEVSGDFRKRIGGIPTKRYNEDKVYEYKRRFQTHGLEGLMDLTPIPKNHPRPCHQK